MILQVAMDFVHGKYRSSMLEKHGSAYYDSQTHNLIIRRYRVTLPSLSQSTPCTHTHTWPPVCLPGCRMCINLLKEQQQHTESVPATLVLSINILYLSPGADRTICKIQPFFTTFPYILLWCQHLSNNIFLLLAVHGCGKVVASGAVWSVWQHFWLHEIEIILLQCIAVQDGPAPIIMLLMNTLSPLRP